MTRATDRFIARVDALPVEALTDRELRTRLELLKAEFEQLDHDAEHVRTDTFGADEAFHIRNLQRERSAALDLKARLLEELGSRS